MCITAWCFAPATGIAFVCVANRDETFLRATEDALARAADGETARAGEDVRAICGKDLVGGGSWLGLRCDTGSFIVLTNVRSRDDAALSENPPLSRGKIVWDFLFSSDGSASRYAETLGKTCRSFRGFNAVMVDGLAPAKEGALKPRMAHATNYSHVFPDEPDLPPEWWEESPDGVGSLSNAHGKTEWWKTSRLQSELRPGSETVTLLPEQLDDSADANAFELRALEVLRQSESAPNHELPNTGLPEDVENVLSPICVDPCRFGGGWYGTRTSTVITIDTRGRCRFVECSRTIDPETGSAQWQRPRVIVERVRAPGT